MPFLEWDLLPLRLEKVLERQVINGSQLCNLPGGYCYAVGGDYGQAKLNTRKKKALKTFDRFYEICDEIKQIQFFGGEPLLNLSRVG